jgi:fatty-acyl-CoA synthase
VLAGVREIAEAAVIGLPDRKWGEVPVAVVVLRPNATLDRDALRARFDAALARFKHPRRIVVRAALPRNAMGKVQKHALIADLQASAQTVD